MKYHKLVTVPLLKNTFTVAKLTVVSTKAVNFLLTDMPGFQFIRHLSEFNSIGADILHRPCAYTTGYQGKIFHTCQVMLNTEVYKPVPVLPCPGFYINIITIFFNYINTMDIIPDNQSVKIFGE